MLHGKVALITGSAKGLGRTTAIRLAEQGCDVVVNYVSSREAAEELTDRLKGIGVRATAIRADVTERKQLAAMVEEACARFGGIDILVNNAGPFIRERRLFADYDWEDIDYLLRGNLLGVMALDRLVLPLMRHRGWGRIIHFGYGHAAEVRSWPHRAVYAAAKSALVSFTRTLAEEEAAGGITVNMICPGDIRGDYKEMSIAEARGHRDPESPAGRPGTGEDIARAIAFVCDPASDYMTGNILDITGGLDPIQSMSQRLRSGKDGSGPAKGGTN